MGKNHPEYRGRGNPPRFGWETHRIGGNSPKVCGKSQAEFGEEPPKPGGNAPISERVGGEDPNNQGSLR